MTKLKVQSRNAIFRFSINLLRWVICWGGHMIWFYNRFLINKTYSIFCWSHCDVTTSPESRLKFGRTSDFKLTSDFAFDFWLKWSHDTILVEANQMRKIWWKIVSSDYFTDEALPSPRLWILALGLNFTIPHKYITNNYFSRIILHFKKLCLTILCSIYFCLQDRKRAYKNFFPSKYDKL